MQETLIYSVKATFLGMGVVVFFLSFLSLLMVLLKGLFEKRMSGGKKNDPPGKTEEKGKTPAPSGLAQDNDDVSAGWLCAAAALLLIEEQESEHKTAGDWKPSISVTDQRWIFTER